MLGCLVYEKGIEPHIPVFDKSKRDDGSFLRADFHYDQKVDIYVCPSGKPRMTTGKRVNGGATLLYRASKHDCDECRFKSKCCPTQPARKISRSIYEGARDMVRDIAKTDAYETSYKKP